jgi:prepilin-type N-terminal cleavage/methylation domain-containing protein
MQGFTLLETIAVLAIVGLLSAVSVSSGYNFWVRLQVDEAQNNIYSAIRTARANARSSAGSGTPWVVRIENSEQFPVVIIEDFGGQCRDILPCERISLSNLVRVRSSIGAGVVPAGQLAYNSRGTRLGEAVGGRFEIQSTVFDPENLRRCITVSDALIGTVRKGCPADAPLTMPIP